MEKNAEKAYDLYKEISSKDFEKITTADLNALYNIGCRIKKDTEYKKELDAFVTDEGEKIESLIESFFISYNSRYGLEIRDSLTEAAYAECSEGGYFIVESYKKLGEDLVLTAPTEFSVGDTAHVIVTLHSREIDKPIRVSKIKYEVQTDDGELYGETVENAGVLEFDFKLSRPGWAYFEAIVIGDDGKRIPEFDYCFGGVLFDFEKIRLTKPAPDNLESFWNKQIDRLLCIDPTDPVSDAYDGLVKYDFDSPSDNRFSLVKLDSDYLERLKEYKAAALDEKILDEYDVYEVNLKSPGPCHSSNYLTVPKNREANSLSIEVIYDGYRAYPQSPSFRSDSICLHSSHHGYKLDRPLDGYYDKLREGVCYNYGLGYGGVNSFYEDIEDNYMLYLHLRNLQAIRFVTEPSLSSIIPNLHNVWNGEVRLGGVSMGGYQSICTAALSAILLKKLHLYTLTDIKIEMPAFCDLAGREEGRVPCLTYYTAGMEYFDAAHLAGFIDVPVRLTRVGLGDTTCAPTGIIAMFNNIPKGIYKEIRFIQNSDHGRMPDKDRQKWYKYKYV